MPLLVTAPFTEEEMSRLSRAEISDQTELTDRVEYHLNVGIYELGAVEAPKGPALTSFLEKAVRAWRKYGRKHPPWT